MNFVREQIFFFKLSDEFSINQRKFEGIIKTHLKFKYIRY